MPNKCDFCPTPIDWKKDTWIERHTPGKPVESAHEDCYVKHRFLVKSPGKVLAFSEQHVSTPLRGQEHLRMDCVFVTQVPTTRHTGGALQRQGLTH